MVAVYVPDQSPVSRRRRSSVPRDKASYPGHHGRAGDPDFSDRRHGAVEPDRGPGAATTAWRISGSDRLGDDAGAIASQPSVSCDIVSCRLRSSLDRPIAEFSEETDVRRCCAHCPSVASVANARRVTCWSRRQCGHGRPGAGCRGAAGAARHAGGEANLGAARSRPGRASTASTAARCSWAASSSACSGWRSGWSSTCSCKNLPVHRSMLEISELIYETCKTYLDHAGQVHPDPRAVHRRDHGVLLRRAAALRRAIEGRRSSCSSAWSASPAATASPGSASASTRSPTRAPRSPACAASRIRSTRSRSGPA